MLSVFTVITPRLASISAILADSGCLGLAPTSGFDIGFELGLFSPSVQSDIFS